MRDERDVPDYQPGKHTQRPSAPSHVPRAEQGGWPGHENVGDKVTGAMKATCPAEEGSAVGCAVGAFVGYVVKLGSGA